MLYIQMVGSENSINSVLFASLALGLGCGGHAQEDRYQDPAAPGLPQAETMATLANTTAVIRDPAIDFLGPEGDSYLAALTRRTRPVGSFGPLALNSNRDSIWRSS